MSYSMRETAAPDSYDLGTLDALLWETPFAGKIHYFAEIGSTSTHAMGAGSAGAPHGSVYIADEQTAGRGRGAHTWASPAGSGLYLSALLRPSLVPPLAPGDALWLSLAAGLAAQSAVSAVAGFTPDLRWPNDLLAGPRKLGGILTEMQAEVTRVRFIVVGMGINVHQQTFPPGLADSATSLAIEAPGRELSRRQLVVELLLALDRETRALTGPDAVQAQRSLLTRLEAGSTWIRGKRVIVGDDVGDDISKDVGEEVGKSPGRDAARTASEGTSHSSPIRGITQGLDARGFLLVRTPSGELRTVLSGGVRAWE